MEYKPKSCIFFRDNGFIGDAIIEAQNLYWKEQGKESQWSHIGFVGVDGIFYESTVKIKWVKEKKKVLGIIIKVPKLKFVYGIYATPVEKRMKNWQKTYSQIGIQTNFTEVGIGKWVLMTEKAKKMVKEKVKYGGVELFGTLITLLKWKMTKDPKKRKEIFKKKNPFNTKNVYCIAFVADRFKEVGIDYIDPNIDTSVSTVDHGWYTNLKCERKIIINENKKN